MKISHMVIAGAVVIALLIVACAYLGLIPGLELPGGSTTGNQDAPPNATDCSYTDIQILDMIEVMTGKDLDNAIGISFVRALNMQACGSDGNTYTEVASYYRSLYSDWYFVGEQSLSGAGWNALSLAWTNSVSPSNSTLTKAILTGGGITLTELYGHDTMTITSDGTTISYQAFILWVASS